MNTPINNIRPKQNNDTIIENSEENVTLEKQRDKSATNGDQNASNNIVNNNISTKNIVLDISNAMHDDSKTIVFSPTKKKNVRRKSKNSIDKMIENKKLNEKSKKPEDETELTIQGTNMSNEFVVSTKSSQDLSFDASSGQLNSIEVKTSKILDGNNNSELVTDFSRKTEQIPVADVMSEGFDDQDDDNELGMSMEGNDDQSTIKGSSQSSRSKITLNTEENISQITLKSLEKPISDHSQSTEVNNFSENQININSSKEQMNINEMNESQNQKNAWPTTSDQNFISDVNIDTTMDAENTENNYNSNKENNKDGEVERKSFIDETTFPLSSSTDRSVTPFFLKQVDISNDIIKIDPSLSKDLSLISLNSFAKKVRKPRGESIQSETGSAYSRSSSASETTSNIKVVIRVRPLSSNEKQRGDKQILDFPGEGGIWVENAFNQTKPFTFNAVFQENCTQEVVFEESGIKGLINKALDGFSCTTFAFGQTGSGKTYTITGPPDQSAEDMLTQGGLYGMVPRSFRYLFDAVSERSSMSYCIKASFLEVYNEKVKDLLHPSNIVESLPLRWSRKKGFYVDNLFTVECETVEELMEVLIKGSTYRQVGVHAMNDHSSRSHTMLTVYVDSEEIDTDEDTNGFVISKQGKISFVDLAGSEKVKETKTTGETLVESNNINKSLLTLGNCISALGDPKKRGHHIPYRESKLTKLLADSLGGDGFTLMIACVSPSSHVVQDTTNTLRYANRAKNIRNKPVVKMDPKEQLLQRIKREVKLLKAENLYFREQLGVPCSESQIIITPNQIKGELTPLSGSLSPAIGTGTFSSIQSSRNNSSKGLSDKEETYTPRATTALYALGAKNGLYNMLQEYMNENESLKVENMELHRTRAVAQRQQEEMFRENDRLAKKLDDLGRVMLSTPQSREHVRTWISNNSPAYGIFTRQPTDDRLNLDEGSVRSHASGGSRFPPVRQGSYPNYVNSPTESSIEKRLVERERILLEKEDTNYSVKNSADKIQNDNITKVDDNQEGITMATEFIDSYKDPALTQRDNKEDTKPRKAIKPWRIKKKVLSNEKPTSYAAKFAVRKNLLSKQAPSKLLPQNQDSPSSSEQQNQYYYPPQQPQQLYMPQHAMQSMLPRQQQQAQIDNSFYRSAITQQSYNGPTYNGPTHNGPTYGPPYSQTGYYNYNLHGGAQPFNGVSIPPSVQGYNYNQQLEQDLQSLNGQIYQEINPKVNPKKDPVKPKLNPKSNPKKIPTKIKTKR